ncbi:zinc finger, CCHC-type containing protein [Tanacetum coccineum]
MASSITRTVPIAGHGRGEKVCFDEEGNKYLDFLLGRPGFRELQGKKTAAGIWTKLTSLYMTKSLANRLYLKKKLYTLRMRISRHLCYLRRLHVLRKLYGDIAVWEGILDNGGCSGDSEFKELKKRTEGTKEEAGDGLYVRGRSDHSGKAHSGGSSWFKSRGGTSKLKCFICHSEGHLKRDCPKKKSSGFVKKGKHDQDSDSSDDEGNAYFREALVVVGNDGMVLNGNGFRASRTCTIKGTGKVKIQLHNGSSFILEDVRYVPGLRRSLISLGTLLLKKKGYYCEDAVLGRIAKVMIFGVQKHGGSKQVGFKQLGSKQVGFKQLGFKQVGFKQLGHKQVGFKQLGPGVETGLHGVQDDKRVWFEVELQGAQGDREAEVFQVRAEKGAPWYKGGANITVTGVPEQKGAEGNVAGKKKVKESMKANLGKLLKYNAWSTRWSPIRGSSTRKRC